MPISIPILDKGLDIVSQVIDRVWPNPVEAAAAKLKLYELEKNGELTNLLAQLRVNEVEAAHQSLFVAGWRPAVGWICAASLAYKFLVAPLVVLLLSIFGVAITLPVLDFTEMLTILVGMLGIGGLRTVEKIKGVENPA